ncbi:sister chromatid cohesion protein pds5 [Phtheirospermum japonicum]|uniref:Sister chromatid cohesion protein pds5 n=1 Tax=Phtheirospermum japonicum TaxID=374723 RepID=A0A830C530_9LAMI|nr:sister chromatid cohesion protein pds5 [Phtheirospermum japonicum]
MWALPSLPSPVDSAAATLLPLPMVTVESAKYISPGRRSIRTPPPPGPLKAFHSCLFGFRHDNWLWLEWQRMFGIYLDPGDDLMRRISRSWQNAPHHYCLIPIGSLLRLKCFFERMASSSSEEENAVAPDPELVEELKKLVVGYGNELLKPSGSTEELLQKLDNLDHVLLHTIQDLKVQFEEAIKPSKDALIANEFIRHAEMDVRVSVVSCISEIVRISAPDDPYEDDQMREFFQVAVGAFESLSCMSGRAYTKAVSILRTISYSQSCVLMLDLRMHDLIHQMFHTASHSNAIFSDMENIMRLIIRDDVDCDESALELAKIILANLKKENQNVSPVAFQLAENMFKKCSNYLEDYLEEAGRCLGLPVEDYAEVVVSLFRDPTPSEDMDSENVVDGTSCRREAHLPIDSGSSSLAEGNETEETEKTENFDTNVNFHENQQTSQSCHEPDNLGSPEHLQEMLPENVPIRAKRSKKQNSLIKLEEGYDPVWMSVSCAAMNNSNCGSGSKKRKRSGHPQNRRGKNIVNEDLEKDIVTKNHFENMQESSDKKGKGKMVISEDQTEDDLIETLASESEPVSSKGEALSRELSNPLHESKCTTSKEEVSEVRDAGNCLGDELVGRRVKIWWPLDRITPSARHHRRSAQDLKLAATTITAPPLAATILKYCTSKLSSTSSFWGYFREFA